VTSGWGPAWVILFLLPGTGWRWHHGGLDVFDCDSPELCVMLYISSFSMMPLGALYLAFATLCICR
jgi:hypothetical protein